MADPDQKPLTTTPADLAAAVQVTLDRCFGGLDEADEARRLGLPLEAVSSLRERLVELRNLAASVVEPAKAGGPEAGGPGA